MAEPNSSPQGEAEHGMECEPPEGPIELEPLAIAPIKIEREPWPVIFPPEPPVPQDPLHACPNCDYNLTGLISRRCPECGQPFTLIDARSHGFDLSEDGREYRRWMQTDRAILLFGIALLAFGLSCPCIQRDLFTGTLQFAPSLKTWGVWIVIVPLLAFVSVVNLYYQRRWSVVLLLIGLLAAALGLVAALL
ncbi:MAG TPA: hypothetical protein VMV94_17730 [Phycisphaerae bacterium]|nr:hypothetical protein [Phycisphaerae bacterium]